MTALLYIALAFFIAAVIAEFGFGATAPSLLWFFTGCVFVALSVAYAPERPAPPTPARVCASHGGVRNFNDGLAICIDGYSKEAEL